MTIAVTILCGLMMAYCLVIQVPKDRLGGLRRFLFWAALLGALWLEGPRPFLQGLAVVLLIWPLVLRVFGRGDVGGSGVKLAQALASGNYRDRELAIRAAAESGEEDARQTLISHLANVDAQEDEDELLQIARSLIDGWGLETALSSWGEWPARARMDLMEFCQGSSRFKPAEVMALSRRGMDDDQEAIARRAWRTYAYTVTTSDERQSPDFDFQSWMASTAQDPNTEIQGLRTRLEQKRVAQAQNQGIDVLSSRYRSESFKQARPQRVKLQVEQLQTLESEDGEERELPAGLWTGELSGSFDNAQDAVHEGRRFQLDLESVDGEALRITAVWEHVAFFFEILNERYDEGRVWLDDADDDIRKALSSHPFVGPVVTYGDTWDLLGPKISGETLALIKKQLVSCLIAVLPPEEDQETRLVFLLFEIEDAEEEGDEIRPFVNLIPLSRWILGGEGSEGPESLIVESKSDATP